MEMDVDFIEKSHGFKCKKCGKPFSITAHFGKDWTIDGYILVCECGHRSKVLPSCEDAYNKLVCDGSIKKERIVTESNSVSTESRCQGCIKEITCMREVAGVGPLKQSCDHRKPMPRMHKRNHVQA